MIVRQPSRRTMLTVIGAVAIETACFGQAPADALTPERFGAKGDGVSNDTAAFAALAGEIMRRGGGTVTLRRTTYIVGVQNDTHGGDAFYRAPAPIFSVSDLPRPFRLIGNGARLRCAPGLLYGSFDPTTGKPLVTHGANYDHRTIASPYQSMISVVRCQGALEISDLELDGNSGALRIGGSYGDVGIQIGAVGLYLQDNRGDEILRRIRSHHHAEDGMMINGTVHPLPSTRRIADDIHCEDNGRQGCSLIGGTGWSFDRCTFARSGRGPVSSPPAAGFDIEAEGDKRNRDHRFTDCSFIDNAGCGMVADSGDSADLTFVRCLFVGTNSPSAWPNKPGMTFVECRFAGTVVDSFGSPDPARATRFVRCLFSDDPALSPTRKIFREGHADGALANLGNAANILFDQCRFLAVAGATLPWSTGVIYRNCTFVQRGKTVSYPRGTFVGRNTITGPVDLNGSTIRGVVTVNGARRT